MNWRTLPLVAVAVLVVVGCTPAPPLPPGPVPVPNPPPPQLPATAPAAELSPALAPLAWWLGDWQGDEGREHWIAMDGAIYGIALQDSGMFEVMIVDDGPAEGPADGRLRLIAMPGGDRAVEFLQDRLAERSATFANPAHDAPKRITYARTAEELRATLDAGGRRELAFRFRPGTRTAAPELMRADQAFDADTAARGPDGWMAAMAPGAGMIVGGARVEGEAMRVAMTQLLRSGRLRWGPVASGRHGTLGFTIGKATFSPPPPAAGWRASYVTIWREQPDGGWKAVFDVGRPVHSI